MTSTNESKSKPFLERFFQLTENKTNVKKEIIAGLTTFFAMVYIIFVNPSILGATGMPTGAVFLATIFASVIGTLIMGLFANVPYAQAPGMGLNAFFAFTVVLGGGYSWEAALAMVFICGIINILITITKIRKYIIKAIPKSLQAAIGGGIGIFIAYIGLTNAGLIRFGAVPELANFKDLASIIAMFGIVLTVVLLILKIKGAILIGILATTVVGIITQLLGGNVLLDGQTLYNVKNLKWDLGAPFAELGDVFGAAFTRGFGDLFGTPEKILPALGIIFAFSLTDTFDTIGTFIGTSQKSGIFEKDIENIDKTTGFKTKLDKALFADSVATSIGAVLGTSNTTTFVESAAGIEAGGRTGLTSVVVAILFLLSIVISPVAGLIAAPSTACALVVVGIMMMSSFKEVEWTDLAEAIPAFFAAIVMGLAYSISVGIALGFLFYVLVKVCTGKAKEINAVVWGASILFLLNFIITALI